MHRCFHTTLTLSLAILVACQPDATGTPDDPEPGNETASVAIADVRVGPDSFEAPDELPAGYVTIRFANETDALHSAHLVRLEDGRSADEMVTAYLEAQRTVSPRPAWMVHVGGPIAEKGSGELTVRLEPGNYAWVCVMGPDDAPHFADHEMQALTVTGAIDETKTLAAPDVVVRLVEHEAEFSTPLTSGTHSIQITNAGTQSHLFALARLEEGARAEDFAAWLQASDGPPPATGLTATTVLAPGLSARLDIDLEPGTYVVFCYADEDGTPHIARGALQTITVA